MAACNNSIVTGAGVLAGLRKAFTETKIPKDLRHNVSAAGHLSEALVRTGRRRVPADSLEKKPSFKSK